ncbi:DUF4810 domain-containing protein [Comamonas odontotermitis]
MQSMASFTRTTQLALLLAIFALTGCATQKTLYAWNDYSPQVYQYLKEGGGSADGQVLALEKGIEQASAQNAKLPPGYYAHLGLLYLNTGHSDQAIAAWNREKELFPESAQYIDYLMNIDPAPNI